MLDDFSPSLLAALASVAFVAGLARGFSGFGAALIFVPLASALVGPKLAVPILLVIDSVMALGMIPDAWRKAERRDVYVMAAGALIGVPIGTYVLRFTDPETLRWAIVALVLAMLALLMSGWRYHGKVAASRTAFVGVLAGLFSGAAQAGGPPVVAYWLGGSRDHRIVRANIVIYFAISTVISVASYALGGLFSREVLLLSAVAGPLFGAGIYLGSLAFGRVDEGLFRRICFVLIAAAAVLGMPVWSS